MAGPAPILREVHRLRRHAKELQDEIQRAPRLLKAQQAKLASQESVIKEGHEALKMLKVSAHDKETQLKGVQQVIAKHEKQRNEATSKKEYDGLNAEIEHEKKKIRGLEDEILEIMGQIEEQTAKLPELEKISQKALQDVAEFGKTAEVRLVGLREELEKIRVQIREVEATLPTDPVFRGPYNRIIQSMDEDALAEVKNRTCTACHTDITAQNRHDLLKGQFVICKSCGRALYLIE
jgi:predicted  nucleic acid-binding Zn-ribbon protein